MVPEASITNAHVSLWFTIAANFWRSRSRMSLGVERLEPPLVLLLARDVPARFPDRSDLPREEIEERRGRDVQARLSVGARLPSVARTQARVAVVRSLACTGPGIGRRITARPLLG